MAKKRAPNGGGSIRWREDRKAWEARITVGYNPNGTQKRRSVYGKTQAEARQKMTELLSSIDNGTYIEPSSYTVESWMHEWLENFTGDIKHSTRVKYEQDIQNHIIPALGRVKLSKLSPLQVQKFVNGLDVAPKTAQNIFIVLHGALEKAVALRVIKDNPCDPVTRPRVEKAQIEPLDAPEIQKLLAVLDDDVYSDIIRFALLTGMRQGEILGLTRDCIEANKVTVKQTLYRPKRAGEQYSLVPTKNDKPRTLVIVPAAVAILKRQRLAGQLVFTTSTGKPIDEEMLRRRFKRYLADAGLPDHRFHDLRHSYAVMALRAGVDIKTLQETLGHATVTFTLSVYTHVTDTMRIEAAKQMSAYLENMGF